MKPSVTVEKKPPRPTKHQFELFKKECEFWIDYFGLKGWRVEYYTKPMEGSRGQCGWKISGRIATIGLSSVWSEDKECITDKDIKVVAFHEVCELLLSRIFMMAINKIANHEEAAEEEKHNLIRTMENTIFKRAVT